MFIRLLGCAIFLTAAFVGTPTLAQKPVIKDKPGQWVVLGKRTAEFGVDKDVISVTGAKGRYRKIKLKIRNNGLELLDLKVHFGDGTFQDVKVRQFLPAGGETRVIDLVGGARVIKKVTFFYRTVKPKKGRAVVILRGRH